MNEQTSFNYKINQKNHMLVVSLTGEISNHVVPALEACRQEILAKEDVNCVVLYFQNVGQISPDGISMLAQIQREIRSKPAHLRLCSLNEALRTKLMKMGVVRGMECADDLKEALLSFGRIA
ncbi:MAG: STAS domain-containing protein [Bacillota bacterium]